MNTLLLSWPMNRSGHSSMNAYVIARPASAGVPESAAALIAERNPRLALTWIFRPERRAHWTLLPGGE